MKGSESSKMSLSINTNATLWELSENSTAAMAVGYDKLSGMVNGCRVVERQFEFLPWNNPQSVISPAVFERGIQVIGIIVPLICVLGAPLNVLNCLVYCRLGVRDRINFLLFSLACADLVNNVSLFVFTVEYLYTSLMGAFRMNGPFHKALVNSGFIVMNGSTYVSWFISTFISCERCLCVTRPFTAKKFLRTSSTAAAVLVMTALLLGLNYLVVEKYRMDCAYVPSLKAVFHLNYPSEFYRQNTEFVNALNMVVFGVSLPCSFLLTSAVTTAVTVLKLRKAVEWRLTTSSCVSRDKHPAGVVMETREIALTKMLIALTCVFIVSIIPTTIVRTAPLFAEEFTMGGRNQNLFLLGINALLVFSAINSSLNFFIYLKMGSKFRDALRGVCRMSNNADNEEGTGVSVLRSPSEHSVEG